MVNIAMMMATGAEQGGMPRQPGTPAAGATPVSFHESFEGSVGAGLGKRSTLPVTTTNSAGIKGAALRIGLIRVDGDGAASVAKMPADLRETGFEKPLGSSKGSESSGQGVVADRFEERGRRYRVVLRPWWRMCHRILKQSLRRGWMQRARSLWLGRSEELKSLQ